MGANAGSDMGASACSPEAVARAIHRIRDRIRGLEDRKRALLEEQQDLIVRAVTRRD